MSNRLLSTVAAGVAFLAVTLPHEASAAGGNYVINGGTPYEQQQVRQALAASAFNWSIVPDQITITIASTPISEATPGQIILDSTLLDSGEWSWGVVQHEYAHQVDFELLTDGQRTQVLTALGGTTWCYTSAPTLNHSQYGCERLASTIAWAYWPNPENCMAPADIAAESGGMPPAAFRTFMTSLLQTPLAASATAPATATVPAPAAGHSAYTPHVTRYRPPYRVGST